MVNRLKSLLRDYDRFGESRTPCELKSRAEREAWAYRHSHGPLSWEEGGHSFRVVYEVQRSSNFIYPSLEVECDGHYYGIKPVRESYERMLKEAESNAIH